MLVLNNSLLNPPKTGNVPPTTNLLYKSGQFDGTKFPNVQSLDASLNAIEGACATANGTDNCLDLGSTSLFIPRTDLMEVETLINLDGVGVELLIDCRVAGDTDESFEVWINGTNLTVVVGGTTSVYNASAIVGSFHKININIPASSTGMIVSFDGVAQSPTTGTGAIGTETNSNNVRILAHYTGNNWSNSSIAYIKFTKNNTLVQHLVFNRNNVEDGKVYADDVITKAQFEVKGTVSKATTFANTQDLFHYNLTFGFDRWQNDGDSTYMYIPLASDGTSIKGESDTVTGYTWVSKHIQTGNRLLPSENRYQFSESGTDLKDADNGHSWLYSLADTDYAKLDYAEFFGKEPYNNLVVNGRFADGTQGWTVVDGTFAVANNIMSTTGDGSDDDIALRQQIIAVQPNHKMYVSAKMRVTNAVATSTYFKMDGSTAGTSQVSGFVLTENVWSEVGKIITQQADFGGILRFEIIHDYVDAGTANGKVMEVDGDYGVRVYDLTAIYGAGNEPASITADELKNLAGYNIFNSDKIDKVMVYSTGQYPTPLNKILKYTGQ